MTLLDVSVVFFHVLGTRPGAWASAFQWALLVAIAFVVLALVIAFTDVGLGRRSRSATEAGAARPGSAHRP